MRALVTGAAGFIGHHLVHELLAAGHEVAGLDDLSTGDASRLDDVRDRVHFVEGDIRSAADVDRAIEGCEVVYHEAALPSVARSVKDPLATNDVNTFGTITVMQAAARAGVRRVVFAGSSSVYGDSPELPRRETQVPRPLSPYAVSKLAAEGYVHTLGALNGIETIVLRYFNIFGPGQDPESQYAAVIPRFITAALDGRPLTVYGDGRQSRDFTHIANVVSANLLAATQGRSGSTMNIGCGDRYTLLDLVAAIEAGLERRVEVRLEGTRQGDVPHSQADITVAGAELGYRIVVPFPEGIQQTIRSYRVTAGR